MNLKRRNFIQLSTLVAGSAVTTGFTPVRNAGEISTEKPEILHSIVQGVVPISSEERKERLSRAQR
ncbi:MAG TPA: hypothetical protein VNW49_10535, partial [Puia sp.]|nr:hypothetical protein [Puia sp.]